MDIQAPLQKLPGAPNSQNPQKRPKPNSVCRTCGTCRRKKVKCDGQQPKCRFCNTKGLDCNYPHDARCTGIRTRKSDVRELQKQIEQLQKRLDSYDTSTHPAPDESSDVHRLMDVLSGPTRPVDSESNPGTSHHWTSTEIERLQQYDAQTPCIREQQTCENIESLQRQDAASSANASSAGSRPQVFGATSLLHDQCSETPLANHYKENQEKSLKQDYVRDLLISNAALRRQDELTLSYVPSIQAGMDFDGLPPDSALHLLELHWNRQHLSYLLTYRPAIMESLANNGPYINKLLLNAIYLQSSLYSDRYTVPLGNELKGMAFYERFKVLLPSYIDEPSVPTVVALLTCGSCLVPLGQHSAGWTLCGIGYRMLIDLGCHLDISSSSEQRAGTKILAIEQEMRRRVYWGAFVCDKFQSLFLGRPPAMHEEMGNIPHEYLDTFEEVEEWKPYIDPTGQSPGDINLAYRGRPTHAISTFQCLLQLCMISGRIINTFYSIQSSSAPHSQLLKKRIEIIEQLDSWKRSLPGWLKFDPYKDTTPPPHQITPHTTYWTLVILTEQAFLGWGKFNFTLDDVLQLESRGRCISAALNIWRLVEAYRTTFTLRRAQYGISYATYCAVLVLLQMSEEDITLYVECIRFFWTALWEYQMGCNYGLKRPLKLLWTLLHRLETVGQILSLDHGGVRVPERPGGITSSPEQDIFSLSAPDSFQNSWFDELTEDDHLHDNNTIFGIFI
ncbi:fungal-specific transcription factor domain-containing protein [Trichoderma barbatum]